MKARILAPENRKWWTLGRRRVRALHDHARQHDRERRAPVDPERPWHRHLGARVGLQRLRAHLRRAHAHRRQARRPVRAGAGSSSSACVIFTVASLFCGLATSAGWLIGARGRPGRGLRAHEPRDALDHHGHLPAAPARAWRSGSGPASRPWRSPSGRSRAASSPQHLGWNWIFFINVPVGILAIIVTRLVVDESRDTSAEQRLDLPGLLTSGIGLFALTYGLIEANAYRLDVPAHPRALRHRRSSRSSASSCSSCTSARRCSTSRLFKNGDVRGSELCDAPCRARDVRRLLLQLALHPEHPWLLGRTDGRVVPADDVLIILVAPSPGKYSDHVGSRWLIGGGMVLLSVSLFIFSRLEATSNFWDILPGLLVGGLGMAIVMTPITAAAMGSVPVDKAGVGSAVLNSGRQVGGSLGIAVMGAIVRGVGDRRAGDTPSPCGGFVTGYQHRAPSRPRRSRSPARCSPSRPSASTATRRPRSPKRHEPTARLPAAEERRAALLETACRLFSEGSYRGTTTAEIARAAGVTEPVLYRHFARSAISTSPVWTPPGQGLNELWAEALDAEPDPGLWVATMGRPSASPRRAAPSSRTSGCRRSPKAVRTRRSAPT